MKRTAIRTILVVGDGIIGMSAALAFSRALGGVEVGLISLPVDPAAITDQFPATLPTVGRFHAAIGFDEQELVCRAVAAHHLGTRFDDHERGAWIHTFGEVGRNEGPIPFRQIWLGAKEKGAALPFDRYSPASVIGAAGKFVHPSGDKSSPLANYLYGLRLNPERYRALLADATSHLVRTTGTIADIERRSDGGIAALRFVDGQRIEADLFVDCSGPSPVLVSKVSPEYCDWDRWLPACFINHSWDESDLLLPLDHVEMIDHGWRLTATVPGAVMRASVTTKAAPGSVRIRPGHRRNSFSANVLALGDSAVALDPLHGAGLSLAHSSILRALALFPGRECHPLELAEYNRLTALEANRALDYHALFQMQSPGVAMPPESLARTLVHWHARGRLPFFEEETFTESSWEQTLVGLGKLPQAVAPYSRAVDAAAAADAMAAFASDLVTLAARLPDYADYVARMCQTPAAKTWR